MARSAAFWSYAHEDARRDGEALLRLAHRLSDEFALLTGDELVIFIDRDAIEWGEEWRRRIDGALAETTFFIPIVTPRYFTREECRRELLTFAGRAESLGVRELVLPILYVDVPDLDDSSKDEAVALVARMQYVDWRDLRLQDHGSEDYRRAINALASRLSSVASTIDDRERGREVARAEGDSELGTTDSLDELLAELTRLLPEWLASVEDDPIVEVEHKAVDAAYEERLARLRAARAPHSAVLSTQIRHARDLLPLAQRHLTFAETYAARTVGRNGPG